MEIVDEEDYSGLNEEVKIRRASQMIKTKNHKLLESKESCDEFFSRVSLSGSNIYFKYFKLNFKLIKNVCKANVSIVRDKK